MFLNEQPIRLKKVHEQVAERLKTMIIEQQFMPGDHLPSERELQKIFQIGRPAVREALLVLERSGLIALRSGQAATVISADPANIIRELSITVDHFLSTPSGVYEIQAARKLLECGLARQAAKIRTEENLQEMKESLMRSQEVLDDKEAFEIYDLEFHNAVVKVSKSRVFEVTFQAMSNWLREQRSITLSMPGQADISLMYHQAVYDAIAKQDPDAAEKTMNDHLSHVEKTYWAAKQEAKRKAIAQNSEANCESM